MPRGAVPPSVRAVRTDRRYFLVERYLPSMTEDAVAAAVERTGAEATGARHLVSIHLADEETCLSLFEADGVEAVGAANEDGRFPFDRIIEVRVFPQGWEG
jgi:hypothetical protein